MFRKFILSLCLCLSVSAVSAGSDEKTDAIIKKNDFINALQAAVDLNPIVSQQTSEVEASQFALKGAKAQYLPSLGANLDLYRKNTNSLNSTHQGSVFAKQPLWTFGKLSTGIAQSKAEVRVKKKDWLVSFRTVIEETSAAYARISGITQKQKVARNNAAAHERLYQRVLRRSTNDVASQADVNLAYARLMDAKKMVIELQAESNIAFNDLEALTMKRVNVSDPIPQSLSRLKPNKEIKKIFLTEEANIALHSSRLDVIKYEIIKNQRSVLPSLFAKAQHDVQNTSGDNNSWVGLSVEMRLDGLGFVANSQVKQAIAQLSAAKMALDATINDVFRQLKTLFITRKNTAKLLTLQEGAVKALKETKASYYRQYKINKRSWLDVLNIQREWTFQRLSYIQLSNDNLIASLRIASKMGNFDSLAKGQ